MATLHVLRVFTAADGSHGNPLGVFLDGSEVSAVKRQAVALDLGFSETVFVDDRDGAEVRIFTPEVELPFAGHPMVGTAWLLAQEGDPPDVLLPPSGEVGVRRDDEFTWISARAEWSPPFEHHQFGSPGEVNALAGPPEGSGFAYCWAWENEEAGTIRARSFVAEVGIDEDEATGSATLARAEALGREIEAHQGEGSILHARALGDGWAEVGGRVVLDHVRDYPV